MLTADAKPKYETFVGVEKKKESKKKFLYGLLAVALIALISGAMLYWHEMSARGLQSVQEKSVSTSAQDNKLLSLMQTSKKFTKKDALAEVEEVAETVDDVIDTVKAIVDAVTDVAAVAEGASSGSDPEPTDIVEVVDAAAEVVVAIDKTIKTVKQISDDASDSDN